MHALEPSNCEDRSSAYNFDMRIELRTACCFAFLLLAAFAYSQSAPLSITAKEDLPTAELWKPFNLRLECSGGVGAHHWSVIAGSLPRNFELNDLGRLAGTPEEAGRFEFTGTVRDDDNPPNRINKKFILTVATPLTAVWERRVRVSGNRIDGSIKVSNRTGRDFDLTVIALAVNDIGRATAIGYQHFPLKKDIRDLEISFGDTLSPGNYAVNVDVVGEETISDRIFRARLVTGKEQVTQGP
jgi:hypothetical protein